MSEGTELDVTERSADLTDGGELSVMRGLYDPDLDFRKLALEAQYFSRGFRLVDKDELLGVPFVVINFTYRPGFTVAGIQGDFVSCECVIADAATLGSPQVRHQLGERELTVYPNEAVVFNDGGTGCRRYLTELASDMGIADVGLPLKNDKSKYDKPYSMWAAGADDAEKGITADLNGNPFRFIAMRGLRKSEYEIPEQYGKGDACTYYFA
jgi:hypothetical protein